MVAKDVKFLVVHCAATKPGMDIGANEIRQWHTSPPRNWSDIGYHWVIRRDGTLETCRKTVTPGAHARGYNSKSLGVCLVGGISDSGKPENNFTDVQLATLRELIRDVQATFPHAELVGHRDLPGVAKACPCFDVNDWYGREVFAPPGLTAEEPETACCPSCGTALKLEVLRG